MFQGGPLNRENESFTDKQRKQTANSALIDREHSTMFADSKVVEVG